MPEPHLVNFGLEDDYDSHAFWAWAVRRWRERLFRHWVVPIPRHIWVVPLGYGFSWADLPFPGLAPEGDVAVDICILIVMVYVDDVFFVELQNPRIENGSTEGQGFSAAEPFPE